MKYLVGREKVREYAHAIGETAPICHDVEACVLDLERRALAPVDTVFFGGGTPSLLAADQLTRILGAIPRPA